MSDYTYFVMACREATEQENDTDIVLNGLCMVFHAIELVRTIEDVERAANELKTLFPNSEIITTHAGMIGVLDNKMKLKNLEDEIKQAGMTRPIDDEAPDRYDFMFGWRKHQLTVIHGSMQ